MANRFMAAVNSFSEIAFNCGIHRWKTDRFTLLAEFREQSCTRHHRELSRPIQGVARDARISRKSRGVVVLLSPMLCRLEPRRRRPFPEPIDLDVGPANQGAKFLEGRLPPEIAGQGQSIGF